MGVAAVQWLEPSQLEGCGFYSRPWSFCVEVCMLASLQVTYAHKLACMWMFFLGWLAKWLKCPESVNCLSWRHRDETGLLFWMISCWDGHQKYGTLSAGETVMGNGRTDGRRDGRMFKMWILAWMDVCLSAWPWDKLSTCPRSKLDFGSEQQEQAATL